MASVLEYWAWNFWFFFYFSCNIYGKKKVKFLKLLINSLFKVFLWVVREFLWEDTIYPQALTIVPLYFVKLLKNVKSLHCNPIYKIIL